MPAKQLGLLEAAMATVGAFAEVTNTDSVKTQPFASVIEQVYEPWGKDAGVAAAVPPAGAQL